MSQGRLPLACRSTQAWAVRFGAMLMRTEPELALWGRRGVPRRLLEEGFSFEFDDVRNALADVYEKNS